MAVALPVSVLVVRGRAHPAGAAATVERPVALVNTLGGAEDHVLVVVMIGGCYGEGPPWSEMGPADPPGGGSTLPRDGTSAHREGRVAVPDPPPLPLREMGRFRGGGAPCEVRSRAVKAHVLFMRATRPHTFAKRLWALLLPIAAQLASARHPAVLFALAHGLRALPRRRQPTRAADRRPRALERPRSLPELGLHREQGPGRHVHRPDKDQHLHGEWRASSAWLGRAGYNAVLWLQW